MAWSQSSPLLFRPPFSFFENPLRAWILLIVLFSVIICVSVHPSVLFFICFPRPEDFQQMNDKKDDPSLFLDCICTSGGWLCNH